MRQTRTFSDVDPSTITRPSPLSLGLFGYTGTGKTESALRLAHGMVKVTGGDIFFADTENGRGLHFKQMFPRMRYIDFPPPHNALDFADLIESYAERRGVLVIDQMTEEHEGEGGLLDTQEAAKQGKDSRTALAWGIAKGQHKKLVRVFRRVIANIPIIVTWRAQDKLDWSNKNRDGRTEPKPLGEMPIGSKDLPFEMTATYLLPPGAKGMPCLAPESIGERMMTKIPRFLADVVKPGERFTEAHGEAFARWAMGAAADPTPEELRERLEAAGTPEEVKAVTGVLSRLFPKGHPDFDAWGRLVTAAKRRIASGARPPKPPSDPGRTALPPDPEDFPRG